MFRVYNYVISKHERHLIIPICKVVGHDTEEQHGPRMDFWSTMILPPTRNFLKTVTFIDSFSSSRNSPSVKETLLTEATQVDLAPSSSFFVEL